MASLLIERIQQLYLALSPSKQSVARYLIDHWREACFMSAAQLGKTVDVSESVVIRLAQDLGFHGYPELQAELRDLVNERFTLIGRLDQSSDQTESATLLEQVVETDLANIRAIALDNPMNSLNKAVEMIASANRIGVVSYGPTSSLAVYLSFNLNQVLNNCQLLDLGLGDWLDRVRQFGAGDLIIGSSFPRYGRAVCEMLDIAKSKGAASLAITDSPLAPIATIADHALLVRTYGASFHRTLTAGATLCNMLLAMIAVKEKDRVRASLEEKDRLLADRNNPMLY